MVIEKIIGKLKGNPAYKFESGYSLRDLSVITWIRTNQLLRGSFLKLFFKRSDGLVFIGSNVSLRHSYQIVAGRNLILDDNVYVNALSHEGIFFGDNVSIGRNSIILCTGVIAQKGTGISIGSGTGINAGAYFSGQGGITIGENVIMGPEVKIFSENHNYEDGHLNIKDQGVTRKGVKIGDNCWIGAGVTILDGVEIGNGCVIAAGSLVSKTIEDNSVAAGIPAKVIKNRIAQN